MTATWDASRKSSGITLSGGNLTAVCSTAFAGVAVAIDFDAGLIWLYNPKDQTWNGGALSAQNPATGTGGKTYGVTGALFPAWSCNGAAASNQVTANFGGSQFAFCGPPAGFSAWSASATWDASNKGANVTLSNGNLTASSGVASWETTRATVSRSSGKYYFEMQANAINVTSNGFIVGMCNASQVLNSYVGDPTATNGWGWQNIATLYGSIQAGSPGTMWTAGTTLWWRNLLGNKARSNGKYYFECTITAVETNNHGLIVGIADGGLLDASNYLGKNASGFGIQPIPGGTQSVWWHNGSTANMDSAMSAGQTFGVAVNLATEKIWIYSPGTSKWNGDVLAQQDPANGVGGLSFSAVGAPVYPAASFGYYDGSTNDSCVVNFGGSAFANTQPAGFLAWGSETLEQVHYRFRTDGDAADATPTWGASEDTSNFYPNPETSVFRLRMKLEKAGA